MLGSLVLGCVWGLWHLGMLFVPDPLRALPPETIVIYMVDLALWSVVMAWMFERGNRSIGVAIAIHAGAHLDNVSRAPETEVRLRILRTVVLDDGRGAHAAPHSCVTSTYSDPTYNPCAGVSNGPPSSAGGCACRTAKARDCYAYAAIFSFNALALALLLRRRRR